MAQRLGCLLLALALLACGGDSTGSTSVAVSTSAIGEAATTTTDRRAGTTAPGTSVDAAASEVPDPCTLLTADDAAGFDPSITAAQVPGQAADAAVQDALIVPCQRLSGIGLPEPRPGAGV